MVADVNLVTSGEPMAKREFTIEGEHSYNRSSPGRWILSHVARHWWLVVVTFIGAVGNAALAAAGHRPLPPGGP